VFSDNEIELSVFALPLAGNEWRLGNVFHRGSRPLDWPDDRLIIGCDDRLEDRFWIVHIFGALEDIDRYLDQRMLKTNWLRPRPVRRLGIGVGELLATLASQTGLERMVWCPPDFTRKPVAARA